MKVRTQFRSKVKEVCHLRGQIRVLKVVAGAWWLGQAGKIEDKKDRAPPSAVCLWLP